MEKESRRDFLKAITAGLASLYPISTETKPNTKPNIQPKWTEWYAEIRDKRGQRTALVAKTNGRLYEVLLDESGLGMGAGLELNPNCLSRKDLNYFMSA